VYNILLLNDSRSSDVSSLIGELKQHQEINLVVAKNLRELEELFKKGHPIHLLFLVVNHEPSDPLFDLISRNRNMTRLRETHFVSLHSQASATGIQKALMLGVKTLFLEPIQRRGIARTLFNLLENDRSFTVIPSTVGENSKSLQSFSCRVTAFGRIGKIYQHPVGDLQIETDLNLHPGRTIEVRTKLAEDQGLPAFNYTVASSTDQDTYYHYQNSYYLSWKAEGVLKEKMEGWINRNKSYFALPKTKILWVTDISEENLEPIFNKTLFSLYTQSPGRLTQSFLSRLNPRIVIAGDLPELSMKELQKWSHHLGHFGSHPGDNPLAQNERLFITTVTQAPPSWHFIPNSSPAQFTDEFLKVVKPFLLRRVSTSVKQAKYLSRTSNYSRCALSFPGSVTPLSQSYMALDLSITLEKNTILFVQCSTLEDPRKFGLYLKALKTEPSGDPAVSRHICELIPMSDDPNPSLDQYIKSNNAETRSKSKLTPRRSDPGPDVPPRSGDLFFLKPQSTVFTILKQVLAALLLLFGISLFLYNRIPRTEERHPSANEEGISRMEQTLRAIRNAFN